MQGGAFRGFVQQLMGKVRFKDFMNMRKVCKMWWEVSFYNQSKWYYWLRFYGEQDGWVYIHHKKVTCRYGSNCNIWAHHEQVQRKPKLLKTKPLHTQVFLQGLRRRKKKAVRGFKYADHYFEVSANNTHFYRESRERYIKMNMETDKAIEEVDTHQRKRIQLNISKP